METKTAFAQGQLRGLVERIERLEEEKKTIASKFGSHEGDVGSPAVQVAQLTARIEPWHQNRVRVRLSIVKLGTLPSSYR